MALPTLDGYVHCASCIKESGNGGYRQKLEVGVRHSTELFVNCLVHDLVIKVFNIEPIETECDCCG
jgi:hypothetical protein